MDRIRKSFIDKVNVLTIKSFSSYVDTIVFPLFYKVFER